MTKAGNFLTKSDTDETVHTEVLEVFLIQKTVTRCFWCIKFSLEAFLAQKLIIRSFFDTERKTLEVFRYRKTITRGLRDTKNRH